jgi:hypothetical protein
MSKHKKDCLVCGEEIVYEKYSSELECYYCHQIQTSRVRCIKGHYVCDRCHSASANDLIATYCTSTRSTDPLEQALVLMRNPKVKMHGPEHHFLVPAVLLSSYYNIKSNPQEKEAKIREARERASKVPGGFCGYFGDCGAAVGTGIFVSLITDATPLSISEWRLANMMTSKSLLSIAEHGGPRCCKRNSYLAIVQATDFLKDNFDVEMKVNKKIKCQFHDLNKQCLREKCTFY